MVAKAKANVTNCRFIFLYFFTDEGYSLFEKKKIYAIKYIYLNVIGYQYIKQDNSNAIK